MQKIDLELHMGADLSPVITQTKQKAADRSHSPLSDNTIKSISVIGRIQTPRPLQQITVVKLHVSLIIQFRIWDPVC